MSRIALAVVLPVVAALAAIPVARAEGGGSDLFAPPMVPTAVAGPSPAATPPPVAAPTPAATPAPAAAPAGKTSPDRDWRRLFQRFVEDAAVTPGGWIEGQYSYENLPDESRHFAGPLIAFKAIKDLEAGLRFGYLNINPDIGSRESGFSDIDLYAKYRLPGGRGRFAFGALVKAATADETKGLGTGKPDLEVFGAYRVDLDAVSLVANVGARSNGNPDPPLPSARDSYLFGGAIVLPVTPAMSFVLEGTFESARKEGAKDDARLTLGTQIFGYQKRGGFRAAVALPLSSGAPDEQIIVGGFLTY